MMGVDVMIHLFIHSFSRYALNSTSEVDDIIRARTDAKADCGPAVKELAILEGLNGDIFSYKRKPISN